MIQRIQTVFLLIIPLIGLLSYFFFPELTVEIEEYLIADRIIHPYLIVFSLISMASIILFNKRKLQMTLNKAQILIHSIVLIGLIYLFIQKELSKSDLIWMGTPIISIVFLLLANKGIRNDEELVNSVDRLR